MAWKIVSESSRHVASAGWAALLVILVALFSGATGSQAYEERSPEPTADYASLLAARDSVGTMIDRVVRVIGGPAHESIRVSRAPARFKYWYAGDSANGWAYRIAVSDTSECPMVRLEYALDAAGWTAQNAYIADGPDGGVRGFVSKRQFCVMEEHWDGGDDSDSTYVAAPGCEVTVTLVPRRMDDVPRE